MSLSLQHLIPTKLIRRASPAMPDGTPIASVKTVTTGRRGRPRFVIDPSVLREAFGSHRKITKKGLAKVLGVGRHTLGKQLKLYGIHNKYSEMTDQELDETVSAFVQERPDSGESYCWAELRKQNLRVQRHRLRASLKRLNPLGNALRHANPIQRRKYQISGSNKLWHLDGHMKLITYGFVIHGIIDGYDRFVSD